MGSPAIAIALVGWPILMVVLSGFLRTRTVVLISVIGGNLFLPQAAFIVSGLPNYTKPMTAGLGAILAALLTASPQLLAWRPKLIDLFFFGFLVAPGISSALNGLGAYDAASTVMYRVLEWGVVYWVARALFNDETAIRELTIGFIVGGLVYIPFCLWESVMSPRLHLTIYGIRVSPFGMTKRWGGWRPTVFMQHGLAVAGWMAASSIVAWVAWRSRSIRTLFGIPMSFIAVGLVAMTIGLRSTGAAVVLVAAIGAVELAQVTRMRIVLVGLLLAPILYIGLRVAGWDGRILVELASRLGEDRAGSLAMRLENDAMIVDRAMQRPVFGWGGWGRWRIRDEVTGKDITVSDSWWGILVGQTGVFGLVCTYGTFIAPMFLLLRRKIRGPIFEGSKGAAWGVAMAVLLFVLDTLANAMPNTSFMLAAGGIASYVIRTGRIGANQGSGGGLGPATSSVGPVVASSVAPRPRTIDLR